MYYSNFSSPLGEMYMISDGEKLSTLVFAEQRYFNGDLNKLKRNDNLKIFKKVKAFLNDYFTGKECHFDSNLLAPQGTNFQKEVWDILLKIEYGQTITYKDIAVRLAKSRGLQHMACQAVGNAVGHNPIAIIIPCHRVLGQKGKLVGYAGGIDKKIALLKIEGALN